MESPDHILDALADPTRRAILAHLAEGEAGVMDIAARFPISQPAITRHLKVLEEAGLILRRVDGTRRPCRLNPDGLTAIEGWCSRLREAFEASYSRLDTLLDELQRKDLP